MPYNTSRRNTYLELRSETQLLRRTLRCLKKLASEQKLLRCDGSGYLATRTCRRTLPDCLYFAVALDDDGVRFMEMTLGSGVAELAHLAVNGTL